MNSICNRFNNDMKSQTAKTCQLMKVLRSSIVLTKPKTGWHFIVCILACSCFSSKSGVKIVCVNIANILQSLVVIHVFASQNIRTSEPGHQINHRRDDAGNRALIEIQVKLSRHFVMVRASSVGLPAAEATGRRPLRGSACKRPRCSARPRLATCSCTRPADAGALHLPPTTPISNPFAQLFAKLNRSLKAAARTRATRS